jgi:hypothetical protein
MSDGFSPLEDEFFAAGEALAEPGHPADPEETASPTLEPAGHAEPRNRLGKLRGQLAPRVRSARTRLILKARLLQLRVAVLLWSCAGHALRMAAIGSLGGVRQTFFPLVAVRCPALARASLCVLVFTAATFPAAAVLAATGAL